jgi:pyridoxine kinase
MAQKQVAAIHDISGFGRCSLTVALPVLSAAGIQTSVIPTAVLSTHTGGFTGFTYRDLTDDILPIAKHWNELGLTFDAIYTGFLGSPEQVDLVIEAIEMLRSGDTMVVVDPVMADFGELYTIFDAKFPLAMRKLCAKADVIVPNLTEAALLSGAAYREGPFAEEEVRAMLMELAETCSAGGDRMAQEHKGGHREHKGDGSFCAACSTKRTVPFVFPGGPSKIVLTGVSYADDPDTIGAASYDAESGEFAYAGEKRIEPMYHGTGDVFASVLTAALVNGGSLSNVCAAAVRYTVDCIRRTKAAGTDNRYGVDFESGLDKLHKLINGN